jgi:muramidase (phage lysozyme)
MQRFTVSQQGSPIQGQVSDFNDLITSTRTYTDEALQNSVVSRTLTDKKGNPYRVLVSSEGTELPIVDLQLSRVGGGDFVPSIVSGYVQRVNTFGALNIYRDKERKVLIGRIVHLKDIQVQTGDWVSSGEIVGRQSGKGPRGDNHFPKMIQVSAEKEELDKYIKSLRTGQFNLSSSNLRTTAGPTPKEEIVRSSNKLTQDEFSKLTPLGQTIYNSTLHNKYVKALADVTAWVEGTDFNRESQYAGYNMIIGKTNISYDDLFKYKHPFVGSGRGYVPVPGIGESSASGRYQIMDTWYTGTGLHLIFDPIKPTPNFSPAVQDLVFRYLLYEKRILDDVSSGNFSDSVLDKAAKIWAGYKLSTTGASRYDNQGTPQGERSSVRRALAARVAFYEREEKKELLLKKKEQLRDKLLRETRGSTKYIQINKQIINIDKELKELERSNVTSQDPVSKAKYTAAKPDSDALSPQARQAILSPGRKLTPQQMALIIEEYDNNIETVKNLKKEFKGKKIAVTLSKTQEGVRPQHPNYPNNNPYVVIPKETPTSENITVTPKQGSVVPNIHINVENDQAVAIELLSDPHYYQSLIPNDVFLQDTNFFMRGISRLPQGRIFQDA